MSPEITVLPCTPDRKTDFYRVHCAANQADWCYCAAWWVPTWEGWAERSAADNRQVREELCNQGQIDGYMLYVGQQPVGWCQAGPRDRLAKLCAQYQLTPDPQMWALTCFLLTPAHRGQGLSHQLLAAVLMDLAAGGVRRVQAFPKRGPELDALDVWRGPEAIFPQAGFVCVRDDPRQPVYERVLAEDLGQ